MKRIWLIAGVVLWFVSMSTSGATATAQEPQGTSMAFASTRMNEPEDATGNIGAAEEQSLNVESQYASTQPAGPWKLPQPAVLQNAGITVGGWVEQGITFNSQNPSDKFNGPIATDDRAGEYQLNQAWVFLERKTKTNGYGWDIGGRIDMSYGTDWRFGQCEGLEPTFDSADSFYGLVLPQFYAEVAYNDLTVKLGHFATLSSLEVVPAPANFFYSHSLLSCGYFDPLLVTGLQADYKLNDSWTAFAGFNRGWMKFEDSSETYNFLGGVKWTNLDKRANLMVSVDAGPEGGFAVYNGSNVHDRTNVITVFTYQFTKRFGYGSQYTAGIEENGSVVNPGHDASWYGTEQLFTYVLNEKWTAGLRYECVRDNDGSRVFGIGYATGTNKAWTGQPGMAGTYSDLSLGANYRPNKNLVLRPEVRWDWYDGNANAAGQLPFGDMTKRDQCLFDVDLIFTF
jgi:hypothetical protein